MIYNDFQGIKLSALGMGCMRLPVTGGYADIDEKQTEKMVEYAIDKGVNYFDTAWGYHDGQSELVIGRILKKYPRSSFYLATKFPGYDLGNMDKVEEIFEKQLEKCQVEYFDFYLFHNVCEMNIRQYLDDDKYHIYTYLMEQKKNGRIKHLGFSVHGFQKTMELFMDAYGKDMEFCQIQLNYLDLEFQNAKDKLELLRKNNIPVWVMEPLRGGKLASLPEEYENRLKALRPDETVPAWAFRFLQSIPEVTVTLSGMSDFSQTEQNIKTFEENKPLNDAEMKELLSAAKDMSSKGTLPCTSCRYCTSYCPKELNIPWIIELYNQYKLTGTGDFIAPMALSALPDDKKPGACIGCKSCENVCPQQIKISDMMSDFAASI